MRESLELTGIDRTIGRIEGLKDIPNFVRRFGYQTVPPHMPKGFHQRIQKSKDIPIFHLRKPLIPIRIDLPEVHNPPQGLIRDQQRETHQNSKKQEKNESRWINHNKILLTTYPTTSERQEEWFGKIKTMHFRSHHISSSPNPQRPPERPQLPGNAEPQLGEKVAKLELGVPRNPQIFQVRWHDTTFHQATVAP